MAGSTVISTLLGTWMETVEAIVSRHFCIKQDWFLFKSPQIMALHSTELESGSQVIVVFFGDNTEFSILWWNYINICFVLFYLPTCVATVHTGKLDSKFKAILVNATQWQYYGTPDVRGILEMTWNTSLVRAERVNIELWGYRETGEYTCLLTYRSHDYQLGKKLISYKYFSLGKAYTDSWEGEWVYLYSLAKDQPNNGSFSFLPKPAENGFSSWELGAVRVSPSTYPDGVW